MDHVDETFQNWMLTNLSGAGGFLLGRRTYEAFAGHWPNAAEEEQPIAEPLNKALKYVASHTLREPMNENDLVDEYRVIIDPIVVGGGKRIFHDDGVLRRLRLVESEVTSKGSIIARCAAWQGLR
jgi:dihydrofolate reductase